MSFQTSAITASAMSCFLVPFMMSAVGISLPVIQTDLGATAVGLSWVVGGYVLTLTIISLPIGRLADILGRRRTFLLGTAWFTLATLMTSTAWSIEALIVLRLLQGIGAAMINSTGMAIATSLAPPGMRGKVMGILTACVYTGISAGPVIGGFITSSVGWRWIFYLCIPLGITTWFLALRIKEEWQPGKGEAFDWTGSILYGICVLCLMRGLTLLTSPLSGMILLAVGTASGLLYFKHCRHTPFPVLNISIFTTNKIFLMSNLATLINYAATFVVGFLLSLYLQAVMGFSPAQAGLLLIIQPLIQAIFSPLIGSLSDRINPGILATSGMTLCVVGLFLLSCIDSQTSVFMICLLLILMGIGFTLFASPNMSIIMGNVSPQYYSIASSLITTMRTLGMASSMAICTIVFSFYLEGQPVSEQTAPLFLDSAKIILRICAILGIAGIFCSFSRTQQKSLHKT